MLLVKCSWSNALDQNALGQNALGQNALGQNALGQMLLVKMLTNFVRGRTTLSKTDLVFYLFCCTFFAHVELATDFLVWTNPNQSNSDTSNYEVTQCSLFIELSAFGQKINLNQRILTYHLKLKLN